uniref:Zn-finger protein n=1 Tax=Pithovirus LCPAC403 TaxID=2506596 RepID=A0A481ZBI5_9VIRU|nr:MAG: Zn-finger protein [Pithovirus LCPAC403]
MDTYCCGITKERKRCKRYVPIKDLCHQHTNQNLTRKDWVEYWSILNDKEIVVLPTLQYSEEYIEKYIEKYEESSCFPHSLYKGYKTYLTKELSLMKIDVLIDLINEFIGIDHIWIAIGELDKFPTIDVVGLNCKHKLKKASIYCVKIGKVYRRSNLESQRLIP